MKFNNKFNFAVVVSLIALLLVTGCSGNDEVIKNNEPTLINFHDDFSSINIGWVTGTDDVSSKTYNDHGTYEIKLFKGGLIIPSIAPIAKLGSEYTLEANIEQPLREGHSGMIFNGVEDEDSVDYYVFWITPYLGKYSISRYNEITGDGWTHLTTEETSHLNEWGKNRIKIKQNDDEAIFYINENIVGKLTGIDTHEEGVNVGVFVSSAGAVTEDNSDTLMNSVISYFDDFKVSGYAAE